MTSEEVERLHQQSLIVEGHRDVFEMVRLKRSGENFPLLKKILPRLKRGGITMSVLPSVEMRKPLERNLSLPPRRARKYRCDAPGGGSVRRKN